MQDGQHEEAKQAESGLCMLRSMLKSHKVVENKKQMDMTYEKGYGESYMYSRKDNTGKAIILHCLNMHDSPCHHALFTLFNQVSMICSDSFR